MNRSLVRRSLVALAAMAGFASGGAVNAAEPAPLRTTTVRYADLDLTTGSGAEALYSRILAAARRVCPEPSQWNRQGYRAMRECRAQAVDAAVARIGSPQLAAIATARRPAG